MKRQDAFAKVEDELLEARVKHGPLTTLHEAHSVILEELEELWAEIKLQHPAMPNIRKEAAHVAAMAIRLLIDLG